MSRGTATIGSCLAAAAGLPADNTEADFAAMTWVDSGEVITLGDVGAENEVITFPTVCDGSLNKRMGATNWGQQTFEIAHDSLNAFQELVRNAAETTPKPPISFRETLSTTDVLYYSGYIASFKTMAGGSSDVVKASVTLELDAPIVMVKRAA